MSLQAAYIVPHPPLIIPDVGRGQENKIEKTIDAYHKIAQEIAQKRPQTIIIATPHSISYADYLHISPGEKAYGDFAQFGAPRVKISASYDQDLAKKISSKAYELGIMAGDLGEKDSSLDHASMVPLFFINQYYTDYQIIRVSVSGFSPLIHYQFGKCIAAVIQENNRNVVFIASGDLSHKLDKKGPYGFAKEGPVFDKEITEAISNANFMKFLNIDESMSERAGECGLRSFLIMAGALDGKSVTGNLLAYQCPFGVGYATASFTINGQAPNRDFDKIYESDQVKQATKLHEEADTYVQLARQSLEHYVKTHTHMKRPQNLPKEMTDSKAGVFVSLKLDGRLRGCIGTIIPTKADIASEIIQNAVSAGINDPRFDSVQEDELSRLVYSVDVLGEAESINSISELDVKRYGVIVSSRGRRGLLLPNLDGIDTAKQQVKIALQKAGIAPNEPYSMERFEVIRHK